MEFLLMTPDVRESNDFNLSENEIFGKDINMNDLRTVLPLYKR
jgi:hypothetical protein